MTTTLNNFNVSQLTDAEVAIVSASSSEKKFIGAIEVFNTSTDNVEITLWLMAAATVGTTGLGSNERYVKTIPARRSLVIFDFQGQVVDNSMKLSGKA